MQPEEFDVLILGSGEGGKFLAWSEGTDGKRVAVVEQKYVGGSCPNIACLPSKNIIHSAKVASYFAKSETFGVRKNDWSVDMLQVRQHKRDMVKELLNIHLDLFKKSGTEVIMGHGTFIGPKILEVTSPDGSKRVLTGKDVVINTGSHATLDPIPGLIESSPLTHIEALELDVVPAHLVVIGGGYVGLELSQAFRRFGSKVTIVERNDRLIHREDEDVSEAIHQLCKDEGIDVLTNVQIDQVEGISGKGIKLRAHQGNSQILVEGSHLLVASGRTPNTAGMGLEKAGVELTAHGFVKVDERLQTTSPHTWAAGDCTGGPLFTHISFDDFRVIKANIAGQHKVTTGRQVPYCMFTDPELARVGLSETEAKKQGIAYRLVKMPMEHNLRAITMSETRGFVKALIDVKTDKILGVTVFGVHGGELMAVVQVAMVAGLPYTAIRDIIFTHPTLPEGLISLFS